MKLYAEFNGGQFELEYIGTVYSLSFNSDINLMLTFRKLPDIIEKLAINGTPIDNIKLYNTESAPYKRYLPVYTCVIINRIDRGFNCDVHLTALNLEYPLSNNNRFCLKCNCHIHYLYVIRELLKKFDEETVDNIWNAEIIEFYCCNCYREEF